MNKPSSFSVARTARQAGFTLVEMMVALTIGLIVLMGVAVTFVNIKQTFLSQDKLAQLQDNERLAMTILGAAAQEAGYFPSPVSLTNSQIIKTTDATYGGMSPAQAIFGLNVTAGPPSLDSFSVAFAASANDGLITCQGHTIVAADIPTGSTSVSVRDTFFVNPSTNTLQCIVLVNNSTTNSGGGSAQPLITNVQSMQVLYGIKSNGSVTSYWPAANVTNWSAVKSMRITLNFVNPNNAATPITWVQTINLMNQ